MANEKESTGSQDKGSPIKASAQETHIRSCGATMRQAAFGRQTALIFMGTDINAIFGHRESFPPTDVLMDAMRKGLGGEWSALRDYNPGWGLVYVRGEVGISFGPHAGIASTGYGWLDDRDDKRAALETIRAVARFFRSPSVIFLPDDIEPYIFASKWIGEGSTFDDLRKRLAAIKEPSSDFHAAIRQMPEYYEVDGYVIEKLDHDTV